MAMVSLSNRDRKKLKKQKPAKPRTPRGDATVNVAAEPPAPDLNDRDGLVWLAGKQRVTAAQAKVGFSYRDLFRHVIDFGGADVGSCIERLKTAGKGKVATSPSGGVYTASQARAELFRLRWVVLGGQSDLHTVLDGVCGVGHTLDYLASGNRQRREQLGVALRIGLDLLVADARAKADAKGTKIER